MIRLRDLPIRRKLLVVGIITSSCALVIMSAVFMLSTYLVVRQSVYRDVIAQAAIVSDNTTAALAFSDRTAAIETLQALRAKPLVDAACLYDAARQPFATYIRPGASTACPAAAPGDLSELGSGAVRIGRSIRLGTRHVGFLYMAGNYDEVRDRLRTHVYASVAAFLVGLVAAGLIANRLRRFISEPIVSLAEAAGHLSRGDYDVRALKQGNDEIGSLVDAFNEMVNEVDRRTRERIELLRREQEANRVKDEFLAALSHELRTPLNAILGWSQVLGAAPPSRETLERGLRSLDRNARAQARLIDDLLDVSRIVSGKLHLSIGLVDVVTVVESAVDVIRAAAQAKSISIVTDYGTGPCLLAGDGDRLRQVVWNLLSNAVKFTPHGGSVQITLTPTGDRCELVVRDSGTGIEPAFLPFVFDRFRQADGSMTRQHGGLGLGLAIVREVTLAHGGTVRVESEGLGHGATFMVSLPRAGVSESRPQPASRPRAAAPELDALSVLVVDDDQDGREVAQSALSAAGASILTADCGAQALRLVEQQQFDVVVCDIAMPAMDGYTLIQELRRREMSLGRFTPAVALSAFADHEAEVRARAAGFQAFVAKPYEFIDLITAVRGVSSRSPA